MPQHINIEILSPFAAKFMEGTTLTPAERSEVLRMAQGFACKDSAAAADISPETIRARRKRIYRKLDVSGSGELISTMLTMSLAMLSRRRLEVLPSAQAEAGGRSPGAVYAGTLRLVLPPRVVATGRCIVRHAPGLSLGTPPVPILDEAGRASA
jgi:DNA-binding CsgD family transcriptional regulator